MNNQQLISATSYMWGEDPQVKKTKIEGIYDTTTSRHGGYLVDINIHPKLGKYGDKTNIPELRAFEEDYEAMKVLWVFPELINNPEKAPNWLTRENVIRYDKNDNFLKDFPENPLDKEFLQEIVNSEAKKEECLNLFKYEYKEDKTYGGMIPANSVLIENYSNEIKELIDEGRLQVRDCEGLAYELTESEKQTLDNEEESEEDEL